MRYTVLSCRVMDANRPNGPTVAWCDDAEQAEKIAAALNAAEQRAHAKRQREARAYRRHLEGQGLDTPDDTPSLANCDDWGTGEGRYHGRI
jgi:hypothetical protein